MCKISPCINTDIYQDGMCYYHWKYGGEKKERCGNVKKEEHKCEKHKGIPRASKKRAKQNREDQKQNKQLREIVGRCQLKLTGCTGQPDCVHHPEGRVGNRLTDVKQKLVSCYNCNLRAETHPQEAYEKGVLKYKHKKAQ